MYNKTSKRLGVVKLALFDEAAFDYDSWYLTPLGAYVDQIEKALIKEVLDPKKGEKGLDVGCGTGNITKWLAEMGINMIGFDQSQEMLKFAQEKALSNEHLQLVVGDAHNLPFLAKSFDFAIAVTSLEFVDNPQEVVQEMLRVTKENGRVVLGLLTRKSKWGELYQQIAKENPDHYFAKAFLYTEEDVLRLTDLPVIMKKGVYFPPDFVNFNLEKAKEIEEIGQKEERDGYAFLAVRFSKNAEKR